MNDLYDALIQLEKEKGIKKEVLLKTIQDALLFAYKKNFGSVQNIRIEFDTKQGFYVLETKEVVDTVTNPKNQISIRNIKETHPNAQIGEHISIVITPNQFGRIAAQTAKQVITQRIKEAEKHLIYEDFNARIGEIITGVVQKIGEQNILIDLGKAEGLLPIREQSPKEKHRVGERIKCYILDVKQGHKGPQIILSRTYPDLVRKLFEMEVPEIYEKLICIKGVSREPGFRSKIAVFSEEEKIDAVGSCVGIKGNRVQAIINELGGERIDIINYHPSLEIFIKNALSPAKVSSVTLDNNTKTALVIVPDNQFSLAIGKEGQNVRLAAKLTNWRIDIKSDSKIIQEKEATARIKAEAELFTKKTKIKPESKETSAKEILVSDTKTTSTVPTSNITELQGIGDKVKESLKNAGFVTVKDIIVATVEDLLVVPGIGKATALKLLQLAQEQQLRLLLQE